MPLITDTTSGFKDYFKQYRAEGENTSRWEQFLTGLQQSYDISAQAVQAQTAYDISGAYSNYLRQQRALNQSNILSEPYLEQVGRGLYGQYTSSFAQAQAQRAQSLGEIQQNILEQYQQGEEAVSDWASKASQLTQALYQYGGYVSANEGSNVNYDFNLAGFGADEGGLGFYERVPGSTELTVTQAGLDFYDKLLNAQITKRVNKDGVWTTQYSFADWLRNESGLEDADELADWYEQNQTQYKEALGGTRTSDAEYTPEEQTVGEVLQLKQKLNVYSDKDFASDDDELTYYKSLDTAVTALSDNSARPSVERYKPVTDFIKNQLGKDYSVWNEDGSRVIDIDYKNGKKIPNEIMDFVKENNVWYDMSTGHLRIKFDSKNEKEAMKKFMSKL